MSGTEVIIDSLLRGLVSNVLIGVYVIQDDCFVFVNQRFADAFGYSREALCCGMGPMNLTAPEDQPLAQREIKRRIAGDYRSAGRCIRTLRRGAGGC